MVFAENLKILREKKELTQQQLADALGISRSTIGMYEKGNREPDFETLEAIADFFNINMGRLIGDLAPTKGKWIPVLGYVRAGIPMDAVEYIIDYEEISEEMARKGDFFALQIKGDSMEPRITEGDVVIVRKQPDIESGEIAIVLVNGDEATIKKVQKFDGGINLIPSNSDYDVQTFTNAQIESLPVQILGKVVELRAKF